MTLLCVASVLSRQYAAYQRGWTGVGRWLLLLLAFCMFPAAANDIKIGFVNAGKLLDEAPQAEAAQDRLREEFADREGELLELNEGVLGLEEQLRDSEEMTPRERQHLERELRSRRRELRRGQEEFREDLNIRRNQELAELQKLVGEVIAEVAQRDGFDLIVTEAAVLYRSERIDATGQVLLELQKRYRDSQEW
jgi:outer membrane protein